MADPGHHNGLWANPLLSIDFHYWFSSAQLARIEQRRPNVHLTPTRESWGQGNLIPRPARTMRSRSCRVAAYSTGTFSVWASSPNAACACIASYLPVCASHQVALEGRIRAASVSSTNAKTSFRCAGVSDYENPLASDLATTDPAPSPNS